MAINSEDKTSSEELPSSKTLTKNKIKKNPEKKKKIKNIMATIRFKDQKIKDKYFNWAKVRRGLNFSDCLKMYFENDIQGITSGGLPEYIKKDFEQLKMDNELLKKEIHILKEELLMNWKMLQNKIMQAMNKPSMTFKESAETRLRILEILNEKIQKKRVKLSLTEISQTIHVPEDQVVEVLNELIEQEVVKQFSNMKYGRID